MESILKSAKRRGEPGSVPPPNPDGAIIPRLSVTREITERRAPDAIPDFQALFQSAPGLYIVLTPGLKIAAVSDAYCRATMRNRDQILGRGIFDVFPDDPENSSAPGVGNLRDSLERVVELRRQDAMAIQKYVIRRPASEGGGFDERYWSPLNTPVLDANGNLAWIIHEVEDATKLMQFQSDETARGKLMLGQQLTIKQLHATNRTLLKRIARNVRLGRQVSEGISELQSTEEGFRLLVESVKDYAIFLLDPSGNVASWNVGAERIKGYQAEEIIGQHMSRFYPKEDVASGKPQRELQVALAEGRYEEEGLRVRKDGSMFRAAVAITALRDRSGRHVGFAKVTRGVSARESAKEQLYQAQKMEAVGQLTGGIAHDFNNLLAIMVGNLDLLTERLEGDVTGRDFAEVALSAGLRGAELARKLLAFSRKQALETKAVDVNDLVRDMIEILRRSLGEGIEIEVRTADDLWAADTDPAQLESALVNLAINARDAMPDGGHLTVETANSHLDEQYASKNLGVTPGAYVMLAVTDTGTGIPPEQLDRVIEPFFTTKEIGKGTGLGLSMIYGFATQSGGHLKIYSEVGHGTSVRLYLPRSKTGPETAMSPTSQVAEPAAAGELILVVDDNADVRNMVVAQLATLGYLTLEAADGASAFDLLKATPGIDLLFTDIVMPGGMNGVQLGESARRIRPEICILYTSGFTEASLRSGKAKIITGDQLLSKPYRRSELARTVHEALARNKMAG